MLRRWILPFAICVGGLLGLFFFADWLYYQRGLVKAGREFSEAIPLFLMRQPINLIHVLPMSVLLASSYSIHMLGRHHEIAAVRGAGISITRWCRPIWMIALCLSLLTLWLNEFVVPDLTSRTERLNNQLKNPGREVTAVSRACLGFRYRRGGRDWFFENVSGTGTGETALVKQFDPAGAVVWELAARRTTHEDGAWVFHDATLTRYEVRDGSPRPVQQRHERISMPELNETPAMVLGMIKPVNELSALDMVRVLYGPDELPEQKQRVFRTTVWYRLCFPFACLMAALVGVGMSLQDERGGALRGFAAAVAAVFVYSALSQFLLLLGKLGYVPAVAGGAASTILFVGWGAGTVYRKR